jgi:hypothetical protein
MRKRPVALAFPILLASAVASPARAEGTIKNPGDHPPYSVEVEPHALIGFDRFGEKPGVGVGGRISIPFMDPGFIKKINDNAGITFGVDVIFPGGGAIIDAPIACQWNFFVHRKWSVLGEVGGTLGNHHDSVVHPGIWVGGRYHFNDHVALTMRLGYPTFSLGLSFW